MYKYAVIGKGMFGTAAAKYLTEMSDSVVLIGPDEPRDWKVHNGVFASHYDSGRITRIFDSEYEWALAAKNSIERYKVIETESSIQFFHPVGCIKVVPDGETMQPYIDANEAVANRLDSPTMKLSATSLHSKYPYLSLPPGSVGLLESHSAGWIDPRKLVQAQQIIAKQNGAQVISETVIERKVAADGTIELHTDTGRIIQAEHILVTAGGFTNFNNLLPRKLKLIPRAETTVRILIAEQEWMQLQSMPALIVFLENNPHLKYVYIVPPARYPDNRLYIKIGGDREGDHVFQSLEDLQEWFHSDGGLQAAVDFKSILDELSPELEPTAGTASLV
jgi:sarcosine oxidase